MLVISRRSGESILIGDEIELQVMDISSSRVKIGIAAPRHLPILRKEIKLAAQQNQKASRSLSEEELKNLIRSLHARR